MTALLEPITTAHATTAAVCPDCGGFDVVSRGACRQPSFLKTLPATEQRLIQSDAAASLYVCRRCQLGFRHPTPDPQSLQQLYSTMPTERWQYATQNEAWRLAGEWLRRHHGNDSLRILDVGAFDGAFLQTLPKSWTRCAIEPSSAAHADLVRSGIAVLAEFLAEPSAEQANQFDVVTMFDVFEHFPHAKTSLRHALGYLRPGGHLLLSTGNCAHWTWQLLGGDHWYCEPVQHLRFASHRYMESAVRQWGARVVEVLPHAHQIGRWRDRVAQAYETCAFTAFHQNVWWRPFIKLISLLPGWRYVRHKTTAPYTPALRDHLFFVIEKVQ